MSKRFEQHRRALFAASAALLLGGVACDRGEADPVATASIAPLPPARIPDEVFERLPPGVRPPRAEGDGPLDAVPSQAPEPGPIRERVVHRAASGHGVDLLEIEYTLDRRLDTRIRQILARGRVEFGQVVVLDVSDGRVLANVTTNPVDFPVTGLYPTASLIKVVTAAGILRDHPEAAEKPCRYYGNPHDLKRSQLRPPRSGGRADSFWRALAISNNVCFARFAVNQLGPDGMRAEIERFGMLEAPGPVYEPGRAEEVFDDYDLGELGSGLAGSFISPLAAARLAAVLARGELVSPHWIERVTDGRGQELALPDPGPPRRVLPAEVAAELRSLLLGVTQRGSAKSAFRDRRGRPLLGSVTVAGKTGSLSGTNPTGRYEWFAGVAPAEDPAIAIAAVAVNGDLYWRRGSELAAEVLRAIFCDARPCRKDGAGWLVAEGPQASAE